MQLPLLSKELRNKGILLPCGRSELRCKHVVFSLGDAMGLMCAVSDLLACVRVSEELTHKLLARKGLGEKCNRTRT